MTKKFFPCEAAYAVGLILIALGVALMTRADLGLSMVVAPAYILHLKISEFLPFFSFGMAEYTLQALLLAIMVIVVRKFKLSYLFSFVTAVIYAFILDGLLIAVDLIPSDAIAIRIILYVSGALVTSLGVAFMYRTYIPPEVYELIVKEVSSKFGIKLSRFKTCYDCTSCLIAVILSFCFFGMWHFEGVKLGTILCALFNGSIIGLFGKLLDRKFDFVKKIGRSRQDS